MVIRWSQRGPSDRPLSEIRIFQMAKDKKNEKSSLKINDGPTLKRSGKVVRGFPHRKRYLIPIQGSTISKLLFN